MNATDQEQKYSNYSEYLAVDLAILQQDIELPKVSLDDPLSLATLEGYAENGNGIDGGSDYKLMEKEYTDMVGNFYIPVLFPLVENGESTELVFEPPNTNNIQNQSLESSEYVERNYVSLMIPKCFVMSFRDVIPRDTKFMVAFIGGNINMENISIIGILGNSI